MPNHPPITVREITSSTDWNAWLLKQNPNTFLHAWEWGQIQAHQGAKPVYLGLYANNSQVGAALLLHIPAKRGSHILCPHGPIHTRNVAPTQVLEALIDYVQAEKSTMPLAAFRIAPLWENTPDIRTMLLKHKFRSAPLHVHAELTWVVDISKSEEDILADMRKTTRHAIRKATKNNVDVFISTNPDVLDRFWPLYEATRQRHDFVPYSRSLIKKQFSEFLRQNRVYLAIATHEKKDIAAGIFFQFGSTVFYYHGASIKTSSNISPAQLLQWESILEAKRRGATHYNFWGIAPDTEPNHPFAGITVFKKGFGGKAYDYVHAHDLPLSWRYWPLWFIETLRKKVRGF